MSPRVVFLGSPEFAIPTLLALIENYVVVGVVTQPDRPAGRGRGLRPPPVKLTALEAGIQVIQPHKIGEPEPFAVLEAWAPDVIIVAAFGQILRTPVLELPPHGSINVHASLLPRWRGASPVQAAILAGDPETGVTIMKMDAGVDTGPILSQSRTKIQPDETGTSLGTRLAALGANLLIETLPGYLSGEINPTPQPENGVAYAKLIKKSQGKLDLGQDSASLERQVRAFDPWPGAFITWQDRPLIIRRATVVSQSNHSAPPPGPVIFEGQPALQTSDGLLLLDEVQPAGKKAMAGRDFLRGARGWGAS